MDNMLNVKKIGAHLLTPDLIRLITITDKIKPINYAHIANNTNPDNLQYAIVNDDGHEGELYYWNTNLSKWSSVYAIDPTKYTKEEIDALMHGITVSLEEYKAFFDDAKQDEINRQEYENIRIENENTRISNEELRQLGYENIVTTVEEIVSSESARQHNEDERIANEDIRIANEEARNTKDAEYANNENTRKQNELVRQSNENVRIQNEIDREERFNEMIIGDSPVEVTDARGGFPTLKARLDNSDSVKVDKVAGKQLSTEDYTTDEKNKLANIEEGANKYIHPSTHSSDMIVDTPNKRFVNDSKIAEWDAKETVEGAQAKANHAEANAYAYIDDEINRLDDKINIPEDVEFSGHSSTIPVHDAVVDGKANVVLEGQTLTNHAENGVDYANWLEDATNKTSKGFDIVGNDTVKVISLPTKLQPSTVYTIIYTISHNSSANIIRYDSSSANFVATRIIDLEPNQTGTFKKLITTREEIQNNRFRIQSQGYFIPTGAKITIQDFMILEGDWTNKVVPAQYINDTKSTIGATRIKSVGKNLFDGKLELGNLLSTGVVDNPLRMRSKNFTRVEPNTTYTVSIDKPYSYQIFLYDTNKNYLSFIGNPTSITTPPNCHYIKLKTISDNQNDLNTKIQIEEGDTATEYEPYKEDISYILAKQDDKITNLRSLPNGVRDEIRGGELVKRVSDEYALQPNDIIGLVTHGLGDYITTNINLGVTSANGFGENGYIQHSKYDLSQGNINADRLNGFGYYLSITGLLRLTFPKSFYSDLEQARVDLVGTKLIYQLAEPEIIPIQSSSFNMYKGGQIEVDNIIPEIGFYTDDKISTHYPEHPIGEVTDLYIVDKDTGVQTPLDVSKCIISEDRLSFTHPDLSNGDLIDWDYSPEETYPLPKCTFKAPTNVSSSVSSLLKDSSEKKENIKQLNNKLLAHTGNDEVHVTPEYKESVTNQINSHANTIQSHLVANNPHSITPAKISAVHQNDFIQYKQKVDAHLAESALWKRVDTLGTSVVSLATITESDPAVIGLTESFGTNSTLVVKYYAIEVATFVNFRNGQVLFFSKTNADSNVALAVTMSDGVNLRPIFIKDVPNNPNAIACYGDQSPLYLRAVYKIAEIGLQG